MRGFGTILPLNLLLLLLDQYALGVAVTSVGCILLGAVSRVAADLVHLRIRRILLYLLSIMIDFLLSGLLFLLLFRLILYDLLLLLRRILIGRRCSTQEVRGVDQVSLGSLVLTGEDDGVGGQGALEDVLAQVN